MKTVKSKSSKSTYAGVANRPKAPVVTASIERAARAAILGNGNTLLTRGGGVYEVTLLRPPPNLVVTTGPEGELQVRAERDSPYQKEFPAAWADVGLWTPCPVCRSVLLSDETGRVPGARVCLMKGHRVQLSKDGRGATPTGEGSQ